jgi:hypothetical protein
MSSSSSSMALQSLYKDLGRLTHGRFLNLVYTLGRTPLDESVATDTDNTTDKHKRQTSMPRTGFESTIPVTTWPPGSASEVW